MRMWGLLAWWLGSRSYSIVMAPHKYGGDATSEWRHLEPVENGVQKKYGHLLCTMGSEEVYHVLCKAQSE